LIGRANQRLTSGTPDIEGAFADIGLAEQVDSANTEIQVAKALAHAKRAALLATEGKIADAEKDLKEAETLGALDSQLTSVRQVLAVAYVKQAEDAVQSGNASQVLASASKVVEYDESTVIPAAVLQAIADESVKQLEQSSSDANLNVALIAVAKLPESGETASFRQRIGVILLTRVQSTITSDLSAAASDYIAAIDLGVPASDSQVLRDQLVTALTARCRQSLAECSSTTPLRRPGQDMAKASADYVAVAKLDSQAASSLVADFEKLPSSVLSQLPSSVLSQLPPRKNTLGMEFKWLPGGTFTMDDGNEAHQVTLTKAFELGVYEVTQEQYEAVMGTNPGRYEGPQNPVEQVSWDDAVEFCRKLSELPAEKSAGYVYRLPTEAEWEYACRAATTTVYSFGDSDSELGDYAWYDKNSGGTTHPVGGKKPNPWGLYDMHGNVFEWCQDWYGDYPSGSVTDPTGAAVGSTGAAVGSFRVYRGGCWLYYSGFCRSAFRGWITPDIRDGILGFRVLRSSIK
jgi:formylglycine-generating enzyme required for sulfatase activity